MWMVCGAEEERLRCSCCGVDVETGDGEGGYL